VKEDDNDERMQDTTRRAAGLGDTYVPIEVPHKSIYEEFDKKSRNRGCSGTILNPWSEGTVTEEPDRHACRRPERGGVFGRRLSARRATLPVTSSAHP
jgi:hypothetical protein